MNTDIAVDESLSSRGSGGAEQWWCRAEDVPAVVNIQYVDILWSQ
jgi:hypothetical protein